MRCTVRFRFFSFSSFYSPFLYLRSISSGNSSIKMQPLYRFTYMTQRLQKVLYFLKFFKLIFNAVIGTTYTPSGRLYAALDKPQITHNIFAGFPLGSFSIFCLYLINSSQRHQSDLHLI